MTPTVEPATLTSATFEELVREMIVRIGEDPDREGLVRTPDRVRRSWEFLPGLQGRSRRHAAKGPVHRHL